MTTASLRALERAIELAGSQAELARRIGKKQAHIWNWLNRDKQVPAEAVLSIEAATLDSETGAPRVTRCDLRPDLYPPEERAAA